MSNERDDLCFCPLEEVMTVIGKKWALLIINGIGIYGRIRFNRLMGELHSISPKTLSERLKELQAEGLIKREAFAEIPPRVEYSLTQNGIELRKSIIPIYEWAINRIVTTGRTVHCECEQCKSLMKSQTLSHTKKPANLQ